ncbi:hypothetical protein F383_15662 [Gossypium arboreum]|uniref:Uncharacterized protein n=1 Tax=Gossypium arboreum TaxID=29729 RepID=A0A0B0PYC7_GOSAR|nr:hypothetical protein F383_15662 [Gossypium arboreum]
MWTYEICMSYMRFIDMWLCFTMIYMIELNLNYVM